MKHLLFTIPLLLIPLHQTRAEDAPEVVKIYSGLCESSEMPFAGSGVRFKRNGHYYVLTSEHVLLQGNGKYCHKVWNKAMGANKAELKAADWGSGLALLEIPAPKSDTEFRAQEDLFADLSPHNGDQVIVTGYPHGEMRQYPDSNGYIGLEGSDRHLIADVRSVLKIRASHGEFGMSGGPVYSKARGTLEGILSHQYLQLVGSSRTVIRELAPNSRILQNDLLVIPAKETQAWLSGYFADPDDYRPGFVRDPEQQLRRRVIIFSSGLGFEAVDPKTGNPVAGGAEGVGGIEAYDEIGGSDAPPKETSQPVQATIRVSVDRTGHKTRWYQPRLATWLQSLKDKTLISTNRVEVPYFVRRNDAGDIKKVPIYSLADFFHKLVQTDLEAVPLLHPQGGTTEETSVTSLKTLGKSIKDAAVALRRNVNSVHANQVLDKCSLLGELLADSWELVRVRDIEAVKRPDQEGWKALFDARFDDSVDLKRRLNEAQALLAKLKIG